MHEFANKVVVITGGNSGIGQAITEKFNAEGAKIVIFGRNAEKLSAIQGSLKECIAVQGDVRNLSDLKRLFEETHKKYGKIDILVANAGIASQKKIDDVDEKFFDEIIDTNLKGVFFTVQRAIPYLNNGASIILISSIAAHCGFPTHSVYSAAKAAVSILAKSFSADLIDRKIRVNAISPGFTDTPIFAPTKKDNPNYMKELSQDVPLKRFATPQEIAEAAAYLSSDKASYIVGIDLVIDGGFTSFSVEKS
jgi:NAD(P)-dependent dehydrogenase (short-subunit alcohol dehydrogenase family)